MLKFLVAGLIAAGLASSAQAVSFFSVGAVRDSGGHLHDAGIAPFEQVVASFEGHDQVGYDVNSSGFGIYSGNHHGVAVAPQGDASNYMAVGKDGSVLFDLRSYFASRHTAARSISFYVGSIDSYNVIDVIGADAGGNLAYAKPLLTIGGLKFTGPAGSAARNRRVYINFTPGENVGALRFSSTGYAFEFDSIAVSSAHFAIRQNATIGANDVLPAARAEGMRYSAGSSGKQAAAAVTNLDPNGNAVPEPSSWATMVGGFGMLGGMLRARRRQAMAARA